MKRPRPVAPVPFAAAGLALAALACTAADPGTPPPPAEPRLGLNLAGPSRGNGEMPFFDLFKFSREWTSQQKGKPFGGGPPLQLDNYGWITRLEPDCFAEAAVFNTEVAARMPAGQYLLLHHGKGKLEAGGSGKIVSTAKGQAVIAFEPSKGTLWIRIRETDPNDYIRNIRLIPPGYPVPMDNFPFTPAFLARWRGVACLRFMGWMMTNGSTQVNWFERPLVKDACYTSKGVPVETMVELCNRLGADPWFCMPHQATDSYVREFAKMVKARLDPGLKVYIEYSNETWNSIYSQNKYVNAKGRALGFADTDWEAGWRYTSYRSVQIFKIWEGVFGGTDRLVRVMPAAIDNWRISEYMLTFRDAYKSVDALAIAPYITLTPGRGGLPGELVATWTLDQVFDYLWQVGLPAAVTTMERQATVARKYGLRLVAYEGGQHLVGVKGAENIEPLTALLQAANLDPRMGQIYETYFDAWVANGGDVFNHLQSITPWSKYGSWGLMQFLDDDPYLYPKFLATMRWARRMGQDVEVFD